MTELLHNAWSGWADYMDDGKLAAVLLAVVLYLWFCEKERRHRPLLLYTTVMTVCCILPLTAALLMLYQTKFYNYEWIWSLVPLTAVAAYGITLFLVRLWKTEQKEKRKGFIPVTILTAAVILFCGSMGAQVWDRAEEREERQQAVAVLSRISALYPGENLCLWGPKEIMEYAREKNPSVILPYGRNMWDHYLDGYAYDTYGEELILMEQWMAQVRRGGEGDLTVRTAKQAQAGAETAENTGVSDTGEETQQVVGLEECVQTALAQGVNCILLPGGARPNVVQRMEKTLGMRGVEIEHYWVFYTGEEGINGRDD